MNGDHGQERCWTVGEVAKLMRVSPLTIRRRIDDGQIQAVKFGRLWRITMAEVRRLLQGPGSGAMT